MRTISRLVSGALSLAMASTMVMPGTVLATSESDYSGYSIEQLEKLISKLQQRLEELKKGSKCFISERDLSLGDGDADDLNADVRRLQDFLNEKGHFPYKSTGYFGKVTRAALMAFQRGNGVEANGEFNKATREKAHSMICKKVVRNAEKDKKMEEQKRLEEKKKEEMKKNTSGQVRSIMLKADGRLVRWATEGFSAQGFKVVWSKNPAPTYPTRDGDKYNYLSEPSASSSELDAFSGPGLYYVRVCEYLGGKCGVYSNEVKVELL